LPSKDESHIRGDFHEAEEGVAISATDSGNVHGLVPFAEAKPSNERSDACATHDSADCLLAQSGEDVPLLAPPEQG
jgi:hypothetical protein